MVLELLRARFLTAAALLLIPQLAFGVSPKASPPPYARGPLLSRDAMTDWCEPGQAAGPTCRSAILLAYDSLLFGYSEGLSKPLRQFCDLPTDPEVIVERVMDYRRRNVETGIPVVLSLTSVVDNVLHTEFRCPR
ncbi:hypothetical protein [Arenibaculum pallidiluteum]|uniref:hypothetical protein n=1 Tax=Arenibaculum pallidiluteum TaxID=2812559 RepID=UPI001A96923D|nr:hypothetical protein [Arenibaculum pallidiluteum]